MLLEHFDRESESLSFLALEEAKSNFIIICSFRLSLSDWNNI